MNADSVHEPPDDELIRRFLADREGPDGRAAASELLGRHQRKVYLWCLRIVRDPDRALDLTQDVLTRAWKGLPAFQGRSKFSSWLFVIARNCCFNAVSAPSLVRDDDVEPDSLVGGEASPADRWEQQCDEDDVRRVLVEHLDEEERAALAMRCFERMAVDDITRALRLDGAAGARALLQRARRKLRAALDARAGRE